MHDNQNLNSEHLQDDIIIRFGYKHSGLYDIKTFGRPMKIRNSDFQLIIKLLACEKGKEKVLYKDILHDIV